MEDRRTRVDPDRLKDYAKHVFGTLGGAVTAAMIHLGDRLGLYRALAERPATSEELAERTGLHERWIREWLRQQGSAGILEYDGAERFSMSPENVAVLADEDHPAFGIGMFDQLPRLLGVVDRLPEAFRTGLGLPYDAFGPEGARGIERGLAPWYRNFLVPVAIPKLAGVKRTLDGGGRVGDVGCGAGVALIELAKAFPHSEFHGYDISEHALRRAERNRDEAGLANVSFRVPRKHPLPADASYDLVLTFDCLHDMAHPERAMAAIRKALKPEGVWLIADVKARPTFEENVEKNPMCAMMYGISVMACMSSALSEPGGAGLGTLGLDEERACRMTQQAGFARFRRLEIDHPINAFYEVRP